MSFKMLNDLSIVGRRGDSASFTFKFEDNINEYNFKFQIKKNITDTDSNAVISKNFSTFTNNSFTVDLTKTETLLFTTQGTGYTNYFWGLKAYKGNDYAITLIPKDNEPVPKFSVLPAIIEGNTNNDD